MTDHDARRGDFRPDGGATDHDDMLWRTDAVDRVLALRDEFFETLDAEPVPLDAVAGRVLASAVEAPADVPARDHATMDGFAFGAADDYPLTVREQEVFPEDDPPALSPGEAVRIATGAPLPEGADVVLKREEATVSDGDLRGPDVEAGTYVYERASNVAAGETLFDAGDRLSPKDAILLGDVGVESVPVRTRLSVGVAATGTEIHEGRQSDLDSNMLAGLVRSWGHDATYEGSTPDEYEVVRSLVERVAREHDVVMTTGGTSVGHKDHVVRALADLGEVLFHRVRIRPGKPIAVARLPEQDAVAFAIPGKPVGAHTVTSLVARPFFVGPSATRAGEAAVDATLSTDVGLGPEGFEYAVPVTLSDGRATPLGHVDSPLAVYEDTYDPSVLSSSTRATRADGVVVTTGALSAGETVAVVPYEALEG
ncbi:molybdopterin molybdotransferase MoeA [Haloarchaeobius sp. HRN-SO-5]|uniref:molybdopterin molybdotransferase MoeA n=1 Tax=Haloarchaeobius sp. HRN-SO-5 TaxID=3446118 RepID=UPI003EC00309